MSQGQKQSSHRTVQVNDARTMAASCLRVRVARPLWSRRGSGGASQQSVLHNLSYKTLEVVFRVTLFELF
jgi:hypothetical protein